MNMHTPNDHGLAERVRAHFPDAEGAELAHRVTLLRAIDHAAALRGSTDSWLAAECAKLAHDVASMFVFRRDESVDRLEEATRLSRNLVSAAMRAAALNDPVTPL
ncbi:hypothetical protein IP68_10470 [Blastomonas sp. AAP25]|uniref:hypothetical protein n=1 Tax=Blastomonas sp. AAP25 TaxID=1523416 RepID=UPI0006B9EDDD|nr:hypothetical protein [Blastomonas sp. AAP25]KPF75037.1 hypothetical protein IP68_10470 [Blastomonas sp. AAP25]